MDLVAETGNAWSSVSLQVDWKLEVCTKPSEHEGGSRENEGAHNEEQEGATTNVTDSDTSPSKLATIVANEGANNVENNALTCNVNHSTSNGGTNNTNNSTPFLGVTNTTN